MSEARVAPPRRWLRTWLITWAALAIAFGFLDLTISRAVVDQRSRLGTFVQRYGEVPGYLVIVVALLVADATWRRPRGARGAALSAASLLASTFFAYLAGATAWFLLNPATTPRDAAFPLAAFALVGIAARTPPGARLVARIDPAVVGWARATVALALLNFVLFVQTAKALWGRVRFRDLDPAFTHFTPWFSPVGPGGRGESFPSGHAALGWMFLPLMLVALERGRRRGSGFAVAVVSVAWGIVVATGRVVIGAHYASDVLFPTGVAWACALALHRATSPSAIARPLR